MSWDICEDWIITIRVAERLQIQGLFVPLMTLQCRTSSRAVLEKRRWIM